MGLDNYYSDYGSGSSSCSSSWQNLQEHRWSTFQPTQTERPQKSSSYSDLATGRCRLDEVMKEFQTNGSDSPYNPDEESGWGKHPELSGLGPGSAYCRQQSWPAPERSPAPRLVRAPAITRARDHFATSTPIFDEPLPPFTPALTAPAPPGAATLTAPAPPGAATLSAEQARVLRSLPAAVLHELLRGLHAQRRERRPLECRFCKNNGEREAYYRAHSLKDARGRVECPVLRAFICRRCGASGDSAHTIKYCPLSTNEERIKSTAMMRSVRMASGRRRSKSFAPAVAPSLSRAAEWAALQPPSLSHANEWTAVQSPSLSYAADWTLQPSLSLAADHAALTAASFEPLTNYTDGDAPLDPLWAALEQKLTLSFPKLRIVDSDLPYY